MRPIMRLTCVADVEFVISIKVSMWICTFIDEHILIVPFPSTDIKLNLVCVNSNYQ